MVATTQLLNVGRGSHEIAVDLSADQAGTLQGNKNVNVSLQPSTWIFFVYANDDPKVSDGHVEQELPEGDPLRARLRLDREPRRQGRDPGARRDPVDVPRLAAAERPGQDGRRQGEGGARGVGGRRPEGDDDLPERPDHQRRPLQLDGAEGPVEPEGGRLQHRDLGLADLELPRRLPVGQVGSRPVAVGPRLPRSRRLPRLHARPARRPPRRLAEGRQTRRSRSSPPRRR